MKYIYIILLSVLTLLSCKKDVQVYENQFFISNDGATMPVLVKGNINSDVIILFLHGGPGGNASQATFIPSFQQLEKSFVMAYWDQRASGLSLGNPDESTFTVDQFVEDTYYVVKTLKLKHPNKKIFILGHSWGGALGSAFLSTESYQDHIAGFICMNSGHNLIKGLPLSVEWLGNYASTQISNEYNIDHWTEIKNWCNAEPNMTIPDNYFRYVEFINQTDAYRHDQQEVIINSPTAADILNSRLNLAILFNGQYLSQNFNILELDLSEDMNNIKIPSLVLWGKHDGVNTIEMGYDAFSSIGSNASEKEFIILENSAHEGYLEEPQQFENSIVQFINTYK